MNENMITKGFDTLRCCKTDCLREVETCRNFRERNDAKNNSENITAYLLSVKLKVTTEIPLFSECECKYSFE